jgi:hypothetical protein
MGEKRKPGQHFTPALHLRRFVGEAPKNMVWTYDMEKGTCRPSVPEQTGKQRNFYSWQKADGTFDDGLDQWFEAIEGKAHTPYERLLAGEIPADQERADFSAFVASLYLRSPAILNAFAEATGKMMQHTMEVAWATRERFEKSMDGFDAAHGTKTEDRDAVWEFFRDKEGYTIQVDHLAGVRVIGAADSIMKILFNRNWGLFDAGEGSFITSDAPVQKFTPPDQHYGPMGDGGFMNPAAEITLPLSPTRALIITGAALPSAPIKLGAFEVGQLNHQRAQGAHRYLFAHQKHPSIEALAKQHRDDGPGIIVSHESRLAKVEVVRAGKTGRKTKSS